MQFETARRGETGRRSRCRSPSHATDPSSTRRWRCSALPPPRLRSHHLAQARRGPHPGMATPRLDTQRSSGSSPLTPSAPMLLGRETYRAPQDERCVTRSNAGRDSWARCFRVRTSPSPAVADQSRSSCSSRSAGRQGTRLLRVGHRLVTNDDGPAITDPDGRLDTSALTCLNADEAGRQRTREH